MALVFVGALAVYAFGAEPSLSERDTAEFQLIGLVGGIPHPPGYPLYAIVSRAFGLLPLPDPAFRITLMSSVCGAGALALLVGLALELGFAAGTALAAAILFGASFTWWSAAMRAEVYTLGIMTLLAAVWVVLRARRSRRAGTAFAAAVLLGLTTSALMSTAPVVLVAGLALAWDALRAGWRAPVRLAALAAGFALGLTPYLHLAWLDVHGSAFSYLELAKQAFYPGWKELPADFDSTGDRMRWMLFARDGATPLDLGLRRNARVLVHTLGLLGLFEFGPLLALVPVGLGPAWRHRRREAGWLIVAAVGSFLFAILTTSGPLSVVFMLPGLALMALFAVLALDAMVARARPRRDAPAWLLPVAVAACMTLPHALRLRSYAHPIGPLRWTVLDEGGRRPQPLFTRFVDPQGSRRRAEAVLAATPPDAMLITEWTLLTPLRYLQLVEHQRPDVTVMPAGMPQLLWRLHTWQAEHDPAHEPIVFVTLPDEVRVLIAGLGDSVQVDPGLWVYRVRARIPGLPAPPARAPQ